MLVNKSKFFLVVVSIAIGVIGIGAVEQSRYRSTVGLWESYTAAASSSATVITTYFDDSALTDIKKIPGVLEAQGKSFVPGRIAPSKGEGEVPVPGSWKDLHLFATKDYDTITMDKIYSVEGSWPPPSDGLLLDQTSLDYLGLKVGQQVSIELSNDKTYTLRVAGVIYDPSRQPANMSGKVTAYISWRLLSELGVPRQLNMLSFTVKENQTDLRHIEKVTTDVKTHLAQKNIKVLSTYIPQPGKHWGYDIMNSTGLIFRYLGMLSMLMAATLVFNTILSILTEQIRQIGVMKVFGAKPWDLIKMYLTLILIYGACGISIGMPLAEWASRGVMSFSTVVANFNSPGFIFSPYILACEIGIGLIIPILAALYPILKGTRSSIRDCLDNQKISREFGRSWIDRIVEKVNWFSRPVLLSIRNTFRQKLRLFLTVSTLSLGGAIVISSYCIYASINYTIDRSFQYAQYDIAIQLSQAQDEKEITRLAMEIPGVTKAGGWWRNNVNRIRSDHTESQDISINALPANTELIKPIIIKGRWLTPQDENSLVLDSYLLRNESDIDVGDTVLLKIGENKRPFKVVGISRKVLGNPESFVNERAIKPMEGEKGTTNLLQIVTKQHDQAFQAKVKEQLVAHLKEKGIKVESTVLTNELRKVVESRFNVIRVYLISMGALLTGISMIGLAGTMSINSMERTREFGILRTIGASDSAVFRIVIFEGVVIGGLSWIFSFLLSVPFSKQLSNMIGMSMVQSPLDYTFPIHGAFLWLIVVLFLSVLASLIPAWTASRLTTKDILNYE